MEEKKHDNNKKTSQTKPTKQTPDQHRQVNNVVDQQLKWGKFIHSELLLFKIKRGADVLVLLFLFLEFSALPLKKLMNGEKLYHFF